jgi:hypothetical protein
MNRFNRVLLTTVEEDFRKIGLLPELSEADDPTKPRDIPSPAPEAGEGLDDSEGDKSAHQAGAKQPKPKMGPSADDAKKSGLDPEDDGGSVGAQKGGKGGSTKVAGSKEASIESKQYMKMGKQPMAGAKGKNKGEKAVTARGLKPVKKHAGMMKEGRLTKAASLVEEVNSLLTSAQIDEEIDELMRGFQLVSENSALLADRLTEVSDQYHVEGLISEMEELSSDAAEAIDIMEMELTDMGSDEDEAEAVRHSTDVSEESDLDEADSDRDAEKPYDIPSPAFKGESEQLLNVMVARLMETLESYDNILDEMGMMPEMEAADDGDDHEIHVHTKAKKVHIHHDKDDDGSADAGDDDSMPDDGGDGDDADMHMHGHDDADMDASGDDDMDQDQDQDMDGDDADMDDGGDDDMDSDHDMNSLAARMKALKARREAMSGGRPFR